MSNQDIVVFHDTDLPNMASHCPQAECGCSIHRGVLVQWDEDQDPRVLDFIDHLPDEIRSNLLVVQEHEGHLGLLWKHDVPDGFQLGNSIDSNGDVWIVRKMGTPGEVEDLNRLKPEKAPG